MPGRFSDLDAALGGLEECSLCSALRFPPRCVILAALARLAAAFLLERLILGPLVARRLYIAASSTKQTEKTSAFRERFWT